MYTLIFMKKEPALSEALSFQHPIYLVRFSLILAALPRNSRI